MITQEDRLTRFLTLTGDILAWIPILAPVFFSGALLVAEGVFRFDYLMPAELFPSALIGGVLLVWAARRARSRRQKLIAWGMGLAAGLLVASQGLAVATGLASGETAPGGWAWALVLALLLLYTLAVISLGIGGGLLLRDGFRPGTTG